jgi:hypothetical protein
MPLAAIGIASLSMLEQTEHWFYRQCGPSSRIPVA